MRSRLVQRPLERHGHLEWLITLMARVLWMSIQTRDGDMIQCQTTDGPELVWATGHLMSLSAAFEQAACFTSVI